MKFQTSLAAALAGTATALPGMAHIRDKYENMKRNPEAFPEAAPEADPAGILGGLGGKLPGKGLLGTIDGLLGSVATGTLNPSDRRPEPGFDFRAPGPNDSRGPCPGLNTLANHGYLPRNGYVSAGQILEATSRGFNMGQDLATVLIVFAVLSDGSIQDESWYLGTNPSNGVGGLNRHSTVEADISPNREDFYLGCGDNHHVSSRLFTQNVKFASEDLNKEFSIPTMAKQFSAQGDWSKKYNPSLYYFPFPMIVSVVAFNFYPRFFSNGTSEFGGVANYESISSIIGAKYDKKTDQFEYVPERFPENWYRRSFPYTAAQGLAEGYTMVYPTNPVLPPGALQFDTPFTVEKLMCNIYMGLNSITPLALAGEEAAAEKKLAWAEGLLLKQFKGTLSGCKKNELSKNFYPNQKQLGGPLNPGKTVAGKNGNNVYNKIYFPTGPTKPQC